MSRYRSLAASSLAAVALFAACSSDATTPAATVDGVDLAQDDLVAELEAISANEAYVTAQESAGQTVLGQEEGTFDTAFVAQTLRLRILYSIVSHEIEARDIAIPDDCQANAEDLAAQGVGGTDVLDAFDADYRAELVKRNAEIGALQADLSGYPCSIEGNDEVLQTYFDEHSDQFPDQRCVSVIQVDDQAGADAVLARLAAGDDFATVATELSTEPSTAATGGAIGCVAPGQLTPELDGPVTELPEGGVTDPIEFAGVLVIARVDEVQPASLDTQRDAVISAIGSEVDAAFGAWADEAFAGADVHVDPRYGTWDPTTYQINRPVTEDTTTTTLAAG